MFFFFSLFILFTFLSQNLCHKSEKFDIFSISWKTQIRKMLFLLALIENSLFIFSHLELKM
jgi:hypothetical protein